MEESDETYEQPKPNKTHVGPVLTSSNEETYDHDDHTYQEIEERKYLNMNPYNKAAEPDSDYLTPKKTLGKGVSVRNPVFQPDYEQTDGHESFKSEPKRNENTEYVQGTYEELKKNEPKRNENVQGTYEELKKIGPQEKKLCRFWPLYIFAAIILAIVLATCLYIFVFNEQTASAQFQTAWSTWASWKECDQTCDGGMRQRTHNCADVNGTTLANESCVGQPQESEICSEWSCPAQTAWSTWASWTECDKTCDGGMRLRTHNCADVNGTTLANEFCAGQPQESEQCSEWPCPVQTAWSTWASWTECDKTCDGGMRLRTHNCADVNGTTLANEFCAGQPQETEQCSEWPCPDCSRVCDAGTLNPECDACECDTSILTGFVHDPENRPLTGVSIAYADRPYIPLIETTNVAGIFSVTGICSSPTSLVAEKSMYGTVTVETVMMDATTSTVDITMERMELPFVTENPRSKRRNVGESVAFCCLASGIPPITKYEWFRNGNILEDSEARNETLVLDKLTVEDSGSYRCRVTNDAGSLFSDQATLVISETSGCNTFPQSHFIDLPPECQQPEDLFDVGKCSSQLCSGEKRNQTECQDEEEYCCLPDFIEKQSIHCENYDIQVFVIKSCDCLPCTIQPVTISGVAITESGAGLLFGAIFVNNDHVATTNNKGEFSLQITSQVNRIALTFKDTIFKQVLDTTKVVVVTKNRKVFIRVRMRQRSSPIIVQSTEENVISLTSEALPPFAKITTKANSIFKEDGTSFDGEVMVYVNSIDMRSESDINFAEGDFTAVDKDGVRILLSSIGMVGLELTDTNGQPLTIGGSVQICVNSSQIPIGNVDTDGVSQFKVWILNRNTGIWEFESSLARPQSSSTNLYSDCFVGMIDLSNSDIHNIAWVYLDRQGTDFDDRCVAKIIPYASTKRNPTQTLGDTQFTILTRDKAPDPNNPTLEYFYGYPVANFDSLPVPEEIGECVRVACDVNNNRRYDNYITATAGQAEQGSYMLPYRRMCTLVAPPCAVQNGVPDSDLVAINYMITEGETNQVILISPGTPKSSLSNLNTGPLYKISELQQCRLADETSKHFQFYLPQNLISVNSASTDYKSAGRHTFYPTWVSEPCMMKIDLQSTQYDSLRVTAISIATEAFETGTSIPLYNSTNYQYGVRQAIVHEMPPGSNSFDVCMEYKCPGSVHETSGTTIGSADTDVQINIRNIIDGATITCMVCSEAFVFFGIRQCPISSSREVTSIIPPLGTNEASGFYQGIWNSEGPPKLTTHDPINCHGSTGGAQNALKIICP